MTTQPDEPRWLDGLQRASSLQLYQLKAVIDGMLADPRRAAAARAKLHLGLAVRFVDFRDGQLRRGKIIAIRDTQATVLELGTQRSWKIPCVAIDGYGDAERRAEQSAYEPPPEPAAAPGSARKFRQGDNVTFDDRGGRAVTGVVVRINQRTATVGSGDGSSWRVPFGLLRHVVDI